MEAKEDAVLVRIQKTFARLAFLLFVSGQNDGYTYISF